MRLPVIYKAERELGLADLVRANRLTFAALCTRAGSPRKPDRATASETDPDLYPIRSVLVTTGWNLNDDVFDPAETWAARKTPEDKQVNDGHDCKKIRGHIVSNSAAACLTDGGVGEPISEEAAADELPPQYHLVTDSVVYRHWSDADLQKEVDDLLEEVDKGELAVSMECLFSGFDYALRGPDGAEKVVARGSRTAFLTKHLRAYGGTGRYGEYRVGRLLRNFIFSGVGLVKTPANPHSVILAAGSKVPDPFSATAVYAAPPTQGDPDMTELEKVKAELAATTEKLSKAEIDLGYAKARADEGEKLLGDAKKAIDASAAELKTARDEKAALAAKWQLDFDAAVKAHEATKTDLAAVRAEKQTLERTAKAKDALGLDQAAATKFVGSATKMDDAEFAAHLELVASMKPAKAQPVAGVSDEEVEPNQPGAATAGAPAPALVTPSPDGVSSVAKSIAAYLGADESDE
jgi:hypothetical protein